MIETRPVRGVIPVVQTALNADLSVDSAGQTKLINYLVEKGVGGFWCLGTGSEDMNLTFAKRLDAARAVCEANAGRKPLILGAGFFCLEDILRFIDATADLEFDAWHVMPYHPLLSLDRLDWFYRRIAEHAPKPIWMYTSANWARPITPEFVKRLKDDPNIAGIKFSSSNTVDQLRVIGLCDPGFQVITAVANQWYACLSMGSQGGTTSLAGALPEPLLEIYEYFIAGNHERALDAQHHLMQFLAAMPKSVKGDNFLMAAEEKFILSMRGICQPFTTDYYRDLDESEKTQIVSALESSGFIRYVTG